MHTVRLELETKDTVGQDAFLLLVNAKLNFHICEDVHDSISLMGTTVLPVSLLLT